MTKITWNHPVWGRSEPASESLFIEPPLLCECALFGKAHSSQKAMIISVADFLPNVHIVIAVPYPVHGIVVFSVSI